MVTSRRVDIDARFQGIPAVALGGYVGGLLARGSDGGEVTLRRPVPLGKPLAIEQRETGTVVLLDGDEPLATLDPAVRLDLAVPGPVTLEEASAASERSLQRSTAYRHPFPDCLVCGAGRAEGDGVRLFAGPVAGRELVAAPWTPHLAFADAEGNVLPEFVWAVLDCPTIMALVFRSAPDATDRVVTARLAVTRSGPVRAGVPHVVVGWEAAREGRAFVTGGAILSPDGTPLAIARHTLVPVRWGVPVGLDSWRATRAATL
jgi:hypothetical protein